MKKFVIFVFFLFLFISCDQINGRTEKKTADNTHSSLSENLKIDTSAKTISKRFGTPKGYTREASDVNSFEYYLSNFSLKPYGAKVYYYDGREKPHKDVYVSVLNIDVGNKDLQQCADAVIRLRAEYLFHQKQYDRLHFNFTNGFRADYSKWAEGYRIKISGNTTNWYKAKEKDYSYKTFKDYLEIVFSYAGTLSLSRELKTVAIDDLKIGDVFIHGGSPGHAVIVVDLAVNKTTGKKIFMIAQSYMPAQNIHILANENSEVSPWYDISNTDKLYSPEWTFEKTELMRFKD